MGFFNSLSKTLSNVGDRAKFEADKFQRTSRISGEVNNIKSQIETNVRQLGERALELYQQGAISAPEIASLAQIIAQLRDQQTQKEGELSTAQNETFETWQASQPQTAQGSSAQNVPISSDQSAGYAPGSSTSAPDYAASSSTTTPAQSPAAPSFTGRSYDAPGSTDMSGSGVPNSSSVGGSDTSASGAAAHACPNCGYSVPNSAAFCPNCGTRVAQA